MDILEKLFEIAKGALSVLYSLISNISALSGGTIILIIVCIIIFSSLRFIVKFVLFIIAFIIASYLAQFIFGINPLGMLLSIFV